ncbi:MAG: hypothetical protein ABI091_20940 [Ferruginibacter sp.]
MKKLMFLSLALSLVFTACKKSKNEADNTHQNLLVKRTDSDGLIFIYAYDANNRMTSYTRNSNPYNPAQNYTFTYNSNGSLAEYFESNNHIKGKCTYNANGTIANKKEYSVSGTVETLVNNYTYAYAGGITTESYVYSGTGNGFRNEYKYDVNGNNIEEKAYSNTTTADPLGTFSGTITNANYDAKKNPNSSYPSAFLFPGSAKNNSGALVYNPGGSETYSYEYNADGYPTKKTSVTGVTNYEYIRL